MRYVPYQRFNWICQAFPLPNELEEPSFYGLMCNLANANVKTVIHRTPTRLLVTTWAEPKADAA